MKPFTSLPLLCALAIAGCGSASPQQAATPSVAVTTVAPRQGDLPATVVAYGSVGPSLTGAQTITVPQPGQITELAIAPGMAVRAGQTVATFVTAPTARSSYLQAANAVSAAQRQRATAGQLLTQQLATNDQVTQADKALADARTTLAALGAEGAGATSRRLSAPFDGVVTAVLVAAGDRPLAGAPLVTIARSQAMVVTVGIDPADRAGMAPGQSASVQRLSGGGAITGQVVRVDSALNPRTRLVDVNVSFPDGALMPGEGMKVAIATGQVSGWVVPHKAVATANGPSRIYQIVGGKAKAVPVLLRLATDAGDVVAGAIDPHLPIIVDGAYQVNDGDTVRRQAR